MSISEDSKVKVRIWLEYKGKPVLGKGGANILQAIDEEKSITKAAEKLEMSYRYAWNYLKKINQVFSKPVVKTARGGSHGGGGANLTELGKSLVKKYFQAEKYIDKLLKEEKYWKDSNCKNKERTEIKKITI